MEIPRRWEEENYSVLLRLDNAGQGFRAHLPCLPLQVPTFSPDGKMKPLSAFQSHTVLTGSQPARALAQPPGTITSLHCIGLASGRGARTPGGPGQKTTLQLNFFYLPVSGFLRESPKPPLDSANFYSTHSLSSASVLPRQVGKIRSFARYTRS